MSEYEVQIHQPGAATRRLRVQAAAAHELPRLLGVAPGQLLSVRLLAPPAGTQPQPVQRRRPPLSLRLLSQETAVLLDAGIPLPEALQTLQRKETAPAAAACLQRLCTGLQEGRSWSECLQAEPDTFDALFVAIVRANERSGTLAAALREHARYRAWVEQLGARVGGALIYPALLLLAGLVVVMFLLLFVMPRFAGVFEGDMAALPAASRGLFMLAAAASAHTGLTLALAAAGPIALALAWRSPAARAQLLALAWRLPGLGPRLRTLALATSYRALGLLLDAGLTVPAALQLTLGLAAAPLQPAFARLARRVSEGQRLSEGMDAEGLATPVASRMLVVGEQGGRLAQMLTRSAEFHDEEIERLSDWVAKALTPALMLLMGVVVGAIVVLMYLPIFQIMEQVQ